MRRREFVTLVGGAAAWPFLAGAQGNAIRRLGVVMNYAETDPEAKRFLTAFTEKLAELGWIDGRNLRTDVRWAPGSVDRMRAFAKELVELHPDVILANSTPVTAEFQRETRTIPIVFVVVSDPVGSGFVASLPRPGGNITGFSNAEPTLPGKWLELLTEIKPSLQRVAMMFNPDTAPYVSSYYLPLFKAAAQSRNMTPITAPVHNDVEIETVITSLGRDPGSGLLVMPDNFVEIHRTQIIPRRHETMYLRLTNCLYKLKTAGCSLTGQTLQIYFAAPRHMWTAFSVAQCPRIFPFKCRQNTTWQ